MTAQRWLNKFQDVVRRDGWLTAAEKLGTLFRNRLSDWYHEYNIRGLTDVEARFNYIYEKNYWGSKESKSGCGSTMASTLTFRRQFELVLQEMEIKSLFDARCGDWNWMQHVKLPKDLRYLGGDIVDKLISELNTRYSSELIGFSQFNIISDRFPQVDLWFCRDCLFHFSDADIFKVLKNFVESKSAFAMLTSQPSGTNTVNILTGEYRDLNLELAPFNLPKPLRVIEDTPVGGTMRFVGLWNRQQIASVLTMAPS